MGTAIQIEMALDQAKRFEDELQLLFMQSGKVDVWNKIKSRAAAMDVESAHDARRAKEAAEKHKKEMDEVIELVLMASVFLILIGAIFIAYFLFALMSAFGYNAQASYVELLGQWGMLVMSAYFGGRTLEKIMEMRSKK